MLEELCKRIQHCCATLRRSRNTRNVGSCWVKSLTGFKLCATTRNRVCKRTQHVTSNNVGSCWPTMMRPFARGLNNKKRTRKKTHKQKRKVYKHTHQSYFQFIVSVIDELCIVYVRVIPWFLPNKGYFATCWEQINM